MQFEPQVFVDGLLGIGKAFGGKSVNEGNELASRLSAMRKERDGQNKNLSTKAGGKVPAFFGSGRSSSVSTDEKMIYPSMNDDTDVMPITDFQPTGRGTVGGGGRGMGSNKKKKKKNK